MGIFPEHDIDVSAMLVAVVQQQPVFKNHAVLEQRFVVTEITVLDAAGGINVAHVSDIAVTALNQIVGDFIGSVKIVRDDRIDCGVFVVKIEKQLGQIHVLHRFDILLALFLQFLDSISESLDESAMLDGASYFTIFGKSFYLCLHRPSLR
ncbi:hypothetical protein HMSSN036_68320 [Paenibacillus macerans]|nr:hypothetical protein HMSSN036_68320 [Paenibacillus macerans]